MPYVRNRLNFFGKHSHLSYSFIIKVSKAPSVTEIDDGLLLFLFNCPGCNWITAGLRGAIMYVCVYVCRCDIHCTAECQTMVGKTM